MVQDPSSSDARHPGVGSAPDMAARCSSAAVGIIMLDTAFPRPVGDIGNPDSFPFPVIYEKVTGASVQRAVREQAVGLAEPFIQAGQRLISRGAIAIGTSCGFLILHQQALSDALSVPVASSSLLQLAWVERMLGAGRRCAVITFDQSSLGNEHLRAAGARPDTPVAGMPANGELRRVIENDLPQLNQVLVREELLAVAAELIGRDSSIGAFVLECTNLPPYSDALRAQFGLPVFDSLTMIDWLWRAGAKGV